MRVSFWLPAFFLILGLLVTATAVHQTQRFVDGERQASIDASTDRLRTDFALHLYRHLDVLRTYQAEFAAHPESSPAARTRMTQLLKLGERLPGLDSLGYVATGPGASELSEIRYLHPAVLVGTSQATEIGRYPLRSEAMERARDTGNFAATPPVSSSLPGAGYEVIIVYLPLYRGGLIPTTMEERRRLFAGTVFAALRPDVLMATVMDRQNAPHAQLRLSFTGYAGAPAGEYPAVTLFDSFGESRPGATSGHNQRTLTIAGTIWALDVGVVDVSDTMQSQQWLPWMVMIVGLLMSLLSAVMIGALQRSRQRSLLRADADRNRRVEAETALHLRHRAIEASANAIVIASATKPGYPVEYVNPAFERMTGYSTSEILGKSLRVMHGADTEQEGLAEIQNMLQERREGQATLRNYRKDGQMYWTRVHIAPVRDESGEVTHFVAAKYDITKTREYEQKLQFRAWHDPLTHLPNRHMLREKLCEAILKQEEGDAPFWVAFLDLDNFKLINDTLGHAQGDILLQEIARRLQQALHPGDLVARRGGDEFVFILYDREPPRNAMATLHRIMSAVSRPLKLESQRLYPACSIGVAIHPQDGDEPETLVKHADMAMYHAKEQGRNTFRFYSTALQEQAMERVTLEGDLRAALANEEFELHYQPQLRLADNALTGMEALVRWRHPERGLIPPTQFIPIAEETGLIVPLGEWILRAACHQAAQWRDRGMPELRVAVNLSARQFNDHHLSTLIHRILDESGLAPGQLELELTESLLMEDVEAANATLHKLKGLGITLSLDDFGTGYSSLSQLKRYPLDILKIDRSFVMDIAPELGGDAIIRTIIKLAHNMGMTAIAEGVETPEQEAFLREHGCDAIQGYLVARPMPADEFWSWAQAFRQKHASHAL